MQFLGLLTSACARGCLADEGDQSFVHPHLCGGGRGAAPHRTAAVLLQAVQGHWAVPAGRQHHLRIESQRGHMLTGDGPEVLWAHSWGERNALEHRRGRQTPGLCLDMCVCGLFHCKEKKWAL